MGDAQEHVNKVLYITSIFNTPNVAHDTFMLRLFPMTLTGAARRWLNRSPTRLIDTWDLLKKAFMQRYCPFPKWRLSSRKFTISNKMGRKHYTILGRFITTFSINVPPMISTAIRKYTSSIKVWAPRLAKFLTHKEQFRE